MLQKLLGLINGIKAVRQLHYRVITETGMTTADEMLYPENLPLVDDLISYMTVGARSVEDQQHRFVRRVEQISQQDLKIQHLEISMLCLTGFMQRKINRVSFSSVKGGNNRESIVPCHSSRCLE